MISLKYKKMYDIFIKHYKEKHVNPWHEINEKELKSIFDNIVNTQDINDDYSFNYLMNYIIKRLSGISDAHTLYNDIQRIPMNFKIFNNDVIVNFPNNLRGAKLISINDIDINKIIDEIDNVITYGTLGRKKHEIEKTLFDKKKLFGLPMLRNKNTISIKLLTHDGIEIIKNFDKKETYSKQEMFDYEKYLFGNPGTYSIIDKNLIITYSSLQNKYKIEIETMINNLKLMDLSEIETIIVDIRGNIGGNSAHNKILIDFLKEVGKNIFCLTDYRVFSGGRFTLLDLIKLGATTIGTDISTPLNCYGNSSWIECDKHYFSSSTCFLAPNVGWGVSSKEEYNAKITEEILEPVFFKPNIFVEQSKEDYLKGIDTILEYALVLSKNEYSNNKKR